MFSFFIATSKVQKDRSIMRETDSRVAKYSRRGLIFNFLAYLICLVGGQFMEDNPDLTVTLTIGLLFITLIRGFYLFRFDQLYPRAPQRWRNSYFVATLLGAFWWAVILVSVTTKLNMEHEAPLLWLYTVVFFSTTAHAFAPYQKFLAYYQFIGLIPAAIAAFFVDHITAYLYGVLLIAFYFVLTHQCRLMSENYWERLEAAYALARKAQSIEEEKRDNRASVQLNREFLNFLRNDLHNLVSLTHKALKDDGAKAANREMLKQCEQAFLHVFYNVNDFNSILNKGLLLENRVFNVRHLLQHLVSCFIDEAESNGIQLETALSPTLPLRLKGDPARLAQIVRTLIGISLQKMESGVLLVEVEFLREYENAGELYVNVSSYSDQQKSPNYIGSENASAHSNLAYSVAKGLSELMNGSIEVSDISQEGKLYRLNLKFDVAEQTGYLDFHKGMFAGHSVIFFHANRRIVEIKRRELSALGFEVFTDSKAKKAQQQLTNSYRDDRRIESVFYYLDETQGEAKEFNQALAEHPELRYTHQLIAVTPKQYNLLPRQGYIDNEFFHVINKPAGLYEMEAAFNEIFSKYDDELPIEDVEVEPVAQPSRGKILIISRRENAETRMQSLLDNMNLELIPINDEGKIADVFNEKPPMMALIDCDEGPNFIRIIDRLRRQENQLGMEFLMPVVGVSTIGDEAQSEAYELGVDDFVDVSAPGKDLCRIVNTWISLVTSADG